MTNTHAQAQRARERLQQYQFEGRLVAYRCKNCTFTTILFGSTYHTQLGEHEWPPGVEMTCCDDSTLRPVDARSGNRKHHAALIQLIREENRDAAKTLWNRLDTVDVNELEYRTVRTQDAEDEHDE